MLSNAEAASPVVENHPWQLEHEAPHELMWTRIEFENGGNKHSTELREVIKKIPFPKYNTLLHFLLKKKKKSPKKEELFTPNWFSREIMWVINERKGCP